MKFWIHIFLLILSSALVIHCGGPAEWSENSSSSSSSSSGGTNNLSDNPCYNGTGTDSDGDGLTDECEENLGTPPNDPDCDDDGISDKYDDVNECPGNEDAECDVWCQAQKSAIAQTLANQMLASYAAMRQKNVTGYDIEIERHLMVLGKLSNVSEETFQDEHGANLNTPPVLRTATACQVENNVFFYTKGTVSLAGSTARTPVLIEFCAELGDSPNLEGNVTLTNIPIERWTIGQAGSIRFNPQAMVTQEADEESTFSEILIHSLEDDTDPDIYKRLEFTMENQVSFYDYDESGVVRYGATVETFSRNWKRIGNLTEQAPHSIGFQGLWGSCSEFLGFGC